MSRIKKRHGHRQHGARVPRLLLSVALIAGLAFAPAAVGQNCDQCIQHPCPPKYKYIYEGAPKIKFKCGCPKPICDPCNLPHFGYFQPCWGPWPFPPDWTHCPVPPPAALVPPGPPPGQRYPSEPAKEGETGPLPRRPEGEQPRERTPLGQPGPSAPQGGERTLPVGVPSREPHTEIDASKGTLGENREQWLPPPVLPPLGPDNGPGRGVGSTTPPSPPPPTTGSQEPAESRPASQEPPTTEPNSPYSLRKDGALAPTKDAFPGGAIAQASALSSANTPLEAQRPRKIGSGAAGSSMRMVNSRRIMLDYDLADVPKPDQTLLELWFTQDGRTWERDQTALKTGSPYMVEVNREGTYGFTLIARSVGEKSEAPAPGDAPQVWVEVDWTRPVIHMVHAKPVEGETRQLSIVWIASDNNLAQQPITLSWSESPDGPWKTFAAQLENSGRYTWQVPGNVPTRVYVRVEAFDLVGNAGMAWTPGPVVIPGAK